MKNLKRKLFILPQDKLDAVKKALGAKTETDAVLLSPDSILRQKKLIGFSELGGRIRLNLAQKELERMRRSP